MKHFNLVTVSGVALSLVTFALLALPSPPHTPKWVFGALLILDCLLVGLFWWSAR